MSTLTLDAKPSLFGNLMLVGAQMADLVTFVVAVTFLGIGMELNPIVRHLWVLPLGLLWLIGLKAIVVASALATRNKWITAFGTVVGWIGALSNVLALLSS